jgi:hypothetical protein
MAVMAVTMAVATAAAMAVIMTVATVVPITGEEDDSVITKRRR